MSQRSERNRNSRLVSRPLGNTLYGRITFTKNRDEDSLHAAVSTESNNSSLLVLSRSGTTISLTGNEARTLFSLLEKHYYG